MRNWRLDEDDDGDEAARKPDMPMTSGPVQNALFHARTVLVFGEIDMRLAERVTAQLLALASENRMAEAAPVLTSVGTMNAVGSEMQTLRDKGMNIEGPLPADTLFFRAGRGDFDLVVAMYHDQGHGPVKVLGLEAGVNITVGLDVIRTSVDHGTAFDIAGKGVADERSLLEALRQGAELATRR